VNLHTLIILGIFAPLLGATVAGLPARLLRPSA